MVLAASSPCKLNLQNPLQGKTQEGQSWILRVEGEAGKDWSRIQNQVTIQHLWAQGWPIPRVWGRNSRHWLAGVGRMQAREKGALSPQDPTAHVLWGPEHIGGSKASSEHLWAWAMPLVSSAFFQSIDQPTLISVSLPAPPLKAVVPIRQELFLIQLCVASTHRVLQKIGKNT